MAGLRWQDARKAAVKVWEVVDVVVLGWDCERVVREKAGVLAQDAEWAARGWVDCYFDEEEVVEEKYLEAERRLLSFPIVHSFFLCRVCPRTTYIPMRR